MQMLNLRQPLKDDIHWRNHPGSGFPGQPEETRPRFKKVDRLIAERVSRGCAIYFRP